MDFYALHTHVSFPVGFTRPPPLSAVFHYLDIFTQSKLIACVCMCHDIIDAMKNSDYILEKYLEFEIIWVKKFLLSAVLELVI